MIERAAVRVDHALELGAHGVGFGGVDGDAGASRGGSGRSSTSKARRPPRDDGGQPAGERPARSSCARNRSVRAARSNSSMPRCDRLAAVLGVDRARIGGVDVDQLAGLVARPDRRRQRLRSACAWRRRRRRWRWKRPISSASSRLTPLTSLSRRIARPPTTWPSASIGRPASVVSVIENFSPRSRNAATALSIACAVVGIEPERRRRARDAANRRRSRGRCRR